MSKAKLALVLAIATVLVFSAVAAVVTAEKKKVQSKPKVTLELIWQTEFETPVAAYVVEPDKGGDPVLRAVAFVYGHGVGVPAAYGTRVVVNFADGGGKITRVAEAESDFFGSHVIVSEDGRYIGTIRAAKGAPEFVTKVDFELYDSDGNLVWADTDMDARPLRVLSNATIVSYEAIGWTHFTLRNANGISAVLKPANTVGTGAIDISKNDHIVFNVTNVGEHPGHVVLYDKNGNEMWRKTFDWGHSGKVRISDNGQYIAAIGDPTPGTRLHVLSGQGDVVWQYASGNCEFMVFSSDSRYLAAGINLSELRLFESSSGNPLWGRESEEARSFYSIAVSKHGEFVAAADGGGKRENPAGDSSTVFLFDKNGNEVWRKEFKILSYRAPKVRFGEDGEHLLITNSNRIYCYNIIGGAK